MSRRRWMVAGVAIAAICTTLALRFSGSRGEEAAAAGEKRAVAQTAPNPPPANDLKKELLDLPKRVAAAPTGEASTAMLAEMAAKLRALKTAEAVRLLLTLLEGREDAATKLGFELGQGGDLRAAPTVRVWALDLLGQLDATAAAAYSQAIYARYDSADEWALALRNDWRAAAKTGHFDGLRARALELMAHEPWAANPTTGFLESLDLTVATLAWEAVPRLGTWLDAAPPPLRHGAWIALERMSAEMPEDFLPALVRRPEWLATQPLIRAGLVARADLGAERQRKAVEHYLQRPDVSTEEGRKFLELIPNANAVVAHSLATQSRVPTLTRTAEMDAATLEAMRAWQSRPEFSRWRTEIAAAETRLADNVAAAKRGGFTK